MNDFVRGFPTYLDAFIAVRAFCREVQHISRTVLSRHLVDLGKALGRTLTGKRHVKLLGALTVVLTSLVAIFSTSMAVFGSQATYEGPKGRFGYFPVDVAVDGSGNLYIADRLGSQILKVAAGGSVTPFAGSGTAGFSGDGGLAVKAELNKPLGVTVDRFGSVYIADTGNFRVRKVTPDGIIATVAGNGTPGFSGDGRTALAAQFRFPVSVAVDSTGRLYVADFHDHRIRRVTPDGLIETIAGTGNPSFGHDSGPARLAELFGPYGIAVDPQDNLYIADTLNARIRMVAADGTIKTIAGNGKQGFSGDGGSANKARLMRPLGVAIGPTGAVYISDSGNRRIRLIQPDGMIKTFGGIGKTGSAGDGGSAVLAEFTMPYDCAFDTSGNVYVIDPLAQRVTKILTDGSVIAVPGTSRNDVDAFAPQAPRSHNPARSPLKVAEGVTPPIVANRVEPKYAEDARQYRLQGTVVLEAIISSDGTVEILRVLRALGFGLDENAIDALRQWRFQPGLRNGIPVDVSLNIEVNFNLRR